MLYNTNNFFNISIHAPARGATRVHVHRNMVLDISIHAPARGATDKKESLTKKVAISIHAPARGATVQMVDSKTGVCDFNPRSREGSDVVLVNVDQRVAISIHAPARGATPVGGILANWLAFQSTLPRGERHIVSYFHKKYNRFQSTLPRGERRACNVHCFKKADFNPRSREGSDSYRICFAILSYRFQSTLPRGERPPAP